MFFLVVFPQVELTDGVRLLWPVLVFALGFVFLLFFCFESQRSVEGECRVFEFLKSGRAVFGFKVLVPFFRHRVFVVECGPFRGVARGEAGEVSYSRGHVVEKRVFVFRCGLCAVALVLFFRAHLPRKVQHRVFVDSKLST